MTGCGQSAPADDRWRQSIPGWWPRWKRWWLRSLGAIRSRRCEWTTKSSARLAEELTTRGHPVAARTVARLLTQAGYSLQGNAKTIEGKQHPDRDAQFR